MNEQRGVEKSEEEEKQQQKVGSDEREVSTGGTYAASQRLRCRTRHIITRVSWCRSGHVTKRTPKCSTMTHVSS